MAWEVLSSRQVLDLSPWLTVTTQRVRLPNGTILPDYVLAPPREFSMAVAVDDAGRLVMLRQYKHGLGHEAIELPAGYLDSPDEPPLDCARRELREEAFDFAKLDYRKHVELDPRYLRPTEVDCLLGDASRGCQPAPASLQWVRKVPGTRTCRARR